MKKPPSLGSLSAIVFDFDGVFTDNKVYLNQDGEEYVCCDRRDGLGVEILNAYILTHSLNINCFILSKEQNLVVAARANKIHLKCVQSISNKSTYLLNYLSENNLSAEDLVYVGNDLNDLGAMRVAGFSVAPSDAHSVILNQADLILPQKGGDGFVRAFIELLIGLEKMSAEEAAELF